MNNKPADEIYCGVSSKKIAEAHPKLYYRNVSFLLEFITERYKIHLKKDVWKTPYPWTENPVLKEFKFTNVRREHDRQSRYYIEGIVNNSKLSLRDKIVNAFLFRAWNNFDTLISLGGPFSEEEVYDPQLKERVRPLYKKLQKKEPNRLWYSNAYNQGGCKRAWKSTDINSCKKGYSNVIDDTEVDIPLRVFNIGVWLKELNIIDRLLAAKNQLEVCNIIQEILGFASFLAYQVFVDLTYIEDFPFSENEFTVAGPGCCNGLDKVFIDKDGMTYEECLFWLRDNMDRVFHKARKKGLTELIWQPDVLFSDLPEEDRCMNVMSLENCFCELSKYLRAVDGSGRPRNKYHYKES